MWRGGLRASDLASVLVLALCAAGGGGPLGTGCARAPLIISSLHRKVVNAAV